jgi:hypothetical protein
MTKEGNTVNFNFGNIQSQNTQFGNNTVMNNDNRNSSFTQNNTNEKPKELLDDILFAAEKIQAKIKAVGPKEDDLNTWFTTMLESKGYNVADQTKEGFSGSDNPKEAGELDIKVKKKDGSSESIIEAFFIKDSFDKTNINKHIKKIFVYDRNGNKRNYVFVYCKNEKFIQKWEQYIEYLKDVDYNGNKLLFAPEDISSQYSKFTDIKLGRTIIERQKMETEIIHVFINLGLK